MPVIVRSTDAVSDECETGCVIRTLLSPATTGSDHLLLDHITLEAGATYSVTLDNGAIGWLQTLGGAGRLSQCEPVLDTDAIAYLPAGFAGVFTADTAGTTFLVATVPQAARFGTAGDELPDTVGTLDWTREPVLQSEHDARKRIYLATPKLVGSDIYKGEMIRYPPGTAAPEHHHVGAEHFQYVVSGVGTALLDGVAHRLEAGDVLYNFEHEPHAFINESDADFVFVEFFVPGPCKTIWSPGAEVCAWLPTGADVAGRPPAREIGYHVHGDDSGI